jgi:hypothetical protein
MVVLITALAAFSSHLIRMLERRLMPWADEVRA